MPAIRGGWWEGEEERGSGGRRSRSWTRVPGNSSQLVGGCVHDIYYVQETCVFSLLFTTGYPVPPLAACRQQFISGRGRSCEGKWEEIWSIRRHYKAHCSFAVFIESWWRLQYSRLASSVHTCSLCSEPLALSSAAQVRHPRVSQHRSTKLIFVCFFVR